MKAALIDHDDSFTHNLRHWLRFKFSQVDIFNHRDFYNSEVSKSNYDLLVLSPGPKHPQDYPHSIDFLSQLNSSQHVYGVCLGLQLMATSEKNSVLAYENPKHGKTSCLKINKSENNNLDLNHFENLKVARYHSLSCKIEESSHFNTLAESNDDQIPMWLEHRHKKWLGVQFHPESFLTEQADLHLDYLLKWLKS